MGEKQKQKNRAFPTQAEAMISEAWHVGLFRATRPGKATQGMREGDLDRWELSVEWEWIPPLPYQRLFVF